MFLRVLCSARTMNFLIKSEGTITWRRPENPVLVKWSGLVLLSKLGAPLLNKTFKIQSWEIKIIHIYVPVVGTMFADLSYRAISFLCLYYGTNQNKKKFKEKFCPQLTLMGWSNQKWLDFSLVLYQEYWDTENPSSNFSPLVFLPDHCVYMLDSQPSQMDAGCLSLPSSLL